MSNITLPVASNRVRYSTFCVKPACSCQVRANAARHLDCEPRIFLKSLRFQDCGRTGMDKFVKDRLKLRLLRQDRVGRRDSL